MMNSKMKTAFILLIAFGSFSCKKENDKQSAPSISINKDEVIFLPEGGLDSLNITSAEPWKIILPADADWFQLNKDSGNAGLTTIYIIAKANIGNTTRNTSLTVNSKGPEANPISVAIKQLHDLKITGFMNHKAPGGATIDIYGSGFSQVPSENNVTINGLNALVQKATNINLTVTVPFMAGSGPIIVSSGDKADTSDVDFIYEWIGEVVIVAGGSRGYVDGEGTFAKFYHPQGISFDNKNNMYVADYANYKVRKVTPSGTVSTIPGRIPSWPPDPSGANTDYGLPTATAINSNGEVYIVEVNSNAISKYIPPDSVSLFVGGNSTGHQNGNGTSASFNMPIDIAIDVAGNMYVTDKDNLCIRKITPSGDVTTFAGGQWGFQDGNGQSARFNRPMGIDIDSYGNLFVTDYFNNRVRKITPTGSVTTIAGTGTHGSMDGNALTEATFTYPMAIAVASSGIIYIAEGNGENRIRLIKPNGKVETIVSFRESGSGAPFNFSGIYGLAVDRNGVLHASDYNNNRICRIIYK